MHTQLLMISSWARREDIFTAYLGRLCSSFSLTRLYCVTVTFCNYWRMRDWHVGMVTMDIAWWCCRQSPRGIGVGLWPCLRGPGFGTRQRQQLSLQLLQCWFVFIQPLWICLRPHWHPRPQQPAAAARQHWQSVPVALLPLRQSASSPADAGSTHAKPWTHPWNGGYCITFSSSSLWLG